MPRLGRMDNNIGDDYSGYIKDSSQKEDSQIHYSYDFPLKVPSSVYYAYKPSVQEIYVNAKQYEAIKKRKARRDYLDSLMEIQKSTYLHESRHRHAMNRLRAPSGRFLTKEEMAEIKKREKGSKSSIED